MAGLKLLDRARDAGLEVATEGHELVVRGPGSASQLVQKLFAHKAEVVEELARKLRSVGVVDQARQSWPPPDAVQVRTTEETLWHDWIRDRFFKMSSGTIGYTGNWQSWPMSDTEHENLR